MLEIVLVLVLSAAVLVIDDGAPRREFNFSSRCDYEHEHRFAEHECDRVQSTERSHVASGETIFAG